jgi:hypothetical protein
MMAPSHFLGAERDDTTSPPKRAFHFSGRSESLRSDANEVTGALTRYRLDARHPASLEVIRVQAV